MENRKRERVIQLFVGTLMVASNLLYAECLMPQPGTSLWCVAGRMQSQLCVLDSTIDVIESKVDALGQAQGGTCTTSVIMNDGSTTIPLTAPGTYCLGENLTLASGAPVLDVQTDNVVINLNGFSINGVNGSSGITIAGRQGVTIYNGSIVGDGTATGISTSAGSADVRVEQVTFSSLMTGLSIADASSRVALEDVFVSTATVGILIQNASEITVDKSTCSSCVQSNCLVDASHTIALREVICTRSSNVGLRIINQSYSISVEDCMFNENSNYGVQINNSSAVELLACSAVGNAMLLSQYGFSLENGSTSCLLRDCFAYGFVADGFAAQASNIITFIGCFSEVNNNGFSVADSVTGSLIQECRALNNTSFGFYDDGSNTVSYFTNFACNNGTNYAPIAAVVTSAADALGTDNIDCTLTTVSRLRRLESKIDIMGGF